MFGIPNTFFIDYNGNFTRFQFNLGQHWKNASEPRRNGWSDHDLYNFAFIYLDTALYSLTKPNHVFGLTTATVTVKDYSCNEISL